MMSDELKEIIDAFKGQGKMRFFDPATEDQIVAFEKEHDFTFPSKYKEWLEEWTHDEFKKVYEITGVYFEETENKDQLNLVHKYRLESKQKKATYGFSIVFTAGYYPLGFTLKYSCEDMRLYAIETYII